MEETAKRKKVMSPVQGKDGKTYWVRMGIAFVNKDNSINVYLDGLPTNGKLQVRDWDDSPDRRDGQMPFNMHALPSAAPASDNLPF